MKKCFTAHHLFWVGKIDCLNEMTDIQESIKDAYRLGEELQLLIRRKEKNGNRLLCQEKQTDSRPQDSEVLFLSQMRELATA
jgi:hypothetical protein